MKVSKGKSKTKLNRGKNKFKSLARHETEDNFRIIADLIPEWKK